MLKNSLANATRQQKVAATAEAMIRLEPNATAENIKNLTGITQRDLDDVVDDARAAAYLRQNGKPRVSVPAGMAA